MSNSKYRKLPQNRPPEKSPVIIQRTEGFAGPIPHPDILKGYEVVCPGAAERIIKMAELEQNHRHTIETHGQKSYINNERIGMVFALLICLIAFCGGFFCILHGQPIPGGIISAVPLGMIVTALIQGRKKS